MMSMQSSTRRRNLAVRGRWVAALALVPVFCASCTDDGGASDAAPVAASSGTPAPTNRIDVPASVRENLGITFAKVERREVEATVRVPGAFELQPLARREYRMSLPGEVDLVADQYQAVSPGDVLYRFRSPAWSALQQELVQFEGAVAEATAEQRVATAHLEEVAKRAATMRARVDALEQAGFRQATLRAELAELEASIPRIEAEVSQAKSAVATTQKLLSGAFERAAQVTGESAAALRAPTTPAESGTPRYRAIEWIDVASSEPGLVETIAVPDGSFVEATDSVVATVDPARVRFRASALQSDLPLLATATNARIVPPATPGLSVGDTQDGVAAAVTIGLEADPLSRTITLVALPEESRPWTRAGVSAFLELTVESSGGPALAIPRAAIALDGLVHVFFRRDPNDPDKVIREIADLGATDGRWVVLNSGIGPNDEVVLDGVYELKLASQQSGALSKGGHFHADGTFHGEAD